MGSDMPDPGLINTLEDLAQALTRLRRRAARRGQVQLSVRDIARRANCPPSTLDPYLRGLRLFPQDVYEGVLRALDIEPDQLRPWLDAWDRVADDHEERTTTGFGPHSRRAEVVPGSDRYLYRVVGVSDTPESFVGIITGHLRMITGVDVWVNSENTGMRMPRFEEYSVSAIIRYTGAVRDETGAVVDDVIATELAAAVETRPVRPGTVVTTGSGQLRESNGVQHVIHVAAVEGRPGEGYQQVAEIDLCVANALNEADRLAAAGSARSILFPLLGTGVAGGDVRATARIMVGVCVDHLRQRTTDGVGWIYLLATTHGELAVCRSVLDRQPFLERV
jgi:O-acetyl-ADP-ribose deacetylase (regulator of RNase III)